MCDQQVPHHGLECLGMRCHRVGIDHRYDADGVADLGSVATIAANNPKHLGADGLGILQCADQVRADILFKVASADRENKNCILFPQTG